MTAKFKAGESGGTTPTMHLLRFWLLVVVLRLANTISYRDGPPLKRFYWTWQPLLSSAEIMKGRIDRN